MRQAVDTLGDRCVLSNTAVIEKKKMRTVRICLNEVKSGCAEAFSEWGVCVVNVTNGYGVCVARWKVA